MAGAALAWLSEIELLELCVGRTGGAAPKRRGVGSCRMVNGGVGGAQVR